MKHTLGIHHITAIVGDAQANVDFYAGVLGLRLVKKTVNFDDPGTYHLYFGNEVGAPGTAITFFPWGNAQPGVIGDGQVGVTQYAIPVGSMAFWKQRLESYQVVTTTSKRFEEEYLAFDDYDGLHIELVERASGAASTWEVFGITKEVAIKGFGGAVLYSSKPEATIELLVEKMGFIKEQEDESYVRLTTKGDLGNTIDIKKVAGRKGNYGVGTVHHIAWRSPSVEDEQDWMKELHQLGYYTSDFKDRDYFQSIYFRENGGILFEIATDGPGFTKDEELAHLGEELRLPKQHEHYRSQLETLLPKLVVREVKKGV